MPEMGPSQGQPQQQQAAGGQGEALRGMVMQTDQALGKLAQVLADVSPEAAEALAQLNQGFRQIISQALGGGGGEGGQKPPQAAPPETGGKPAQQAF